MEDWWNLLVDSGILLEIWYGVISVRCWLIDDGRNVEGQQRAAIGTYKP